MECKKPTEVQYLGNLPVDTLESMPDYFLAERDIIDSTTGNVVRSIVRVPSGKIFPQNNMDNVVALSPNNTSVTIPDNQVVPCYMSNTGSAYIMEKADASHHATFLAIGKVSDLILVQNCGFINIPNGHQYVINQKYYLSSTAGEVTTDSTQTGQYLFTPVSSTKLAVNMGV